VLKSKRNITKIVGKKLSKEKSWTRKQLINKHHGLCVLCECQVNLIHDDPRQATIDHIMPLSKGGTGDLGNLQLLCASCNNEKGNSYTDEEHE